MPVGSGDVAVDLELSEISGLVPLLRYVTPINVTEARAGFLGGTTGDPVFEYRPLPDLADVSRRLDKVDPEAADDPAVRHLATNLKRELQTRLDLLAGRGTESFFLAAVELFGHVEGPLHELAMKLLELEPTPTHTSLVSAEAFAAAAQAELAAYRASFPELNARVVIDDATAGVMVENGDLYIASDTRIARDHVVGLINHEIGVHVLTYANGSAQPLRTLATGLAGYDETQEALGVLAEHLTGGLPRQRLRVLAYRVIAAQLRSDQKTFRECFQGLLSVGASRVAAFTTTMRAYRAGGMTKDAIYLRGLVRLCEYLAAGGDLEGLFIGKVSLADSALINELGERGVLTDAPLRPRFLDAPDAGDRLAQIRAGVGVLQLGAMST